ncbi:MarR family transcriptional regulator [Pseudosulfitobacter sp. SM2401]|uniref:MarR family winged helix-turn-helix transcriptional regulator n=1 Tax=Pseudosulfitobacter sp. SM2401 TaxID=3350098 RepID=UPI0036F1D1D7
MSKSESFDLKDFLPYLLAQAAEQTSVEFQYFYKTKYGMLRTEWRVLFHLGRYGSMTAKEICDRARLHKTKVSRAVAALQDKRFLTREQQEKDRRHETLGLTRAGQVAYADLSQAAQRFDRKMVADFTPEEAEVLRRCLIRIASL